MLASVGYEPSDEQKLESRMDVALMVMEMFDISEAFGRVMIAPWNTERRPCRPAEKCRLE